MLLLLDNYDSFTYNLKDYFEQLGETVCVVKNDELSVAELQEINFTKLVLSPGPKTPETAGNMMAAIKAFHTSKPILGVCLGHQALGQFFGATLVKSIKPMHGKISAIQNNQQGIYHQLPATINICRYHSLILKDMDKTPLISTAQTDEGECMSFIHPSLPITGIQYHPEAILTENGMTILRNWLSLYP
ncbi:MAG: aminodeoxychorismate/anthranilate synthase component II [Bacteroidota bacterium]